MTSIRPATPADIPQILDFLRRLAAYENLSACVRASEEALRRDGFGPNPLFGCLMAEDEAGAPLGYLLYYFTYSTFACAPGLFVEDAFVAEEFRGRGVGRALFESAAAVAQTRGCTKMHWQVLDWNEPSIQAYRALGGQFCDEWRNVSLTGEAFARLAEAGAGRTKTIPEGGR